jgi:hypothetical protein
LQSDEDRRTGVHCELCRGVKPIAPTGRERELRSFEVARIDPSSAPRCRAKFSTATVERYVHNRVLRAGKARSTPASRLARFSSNLARVFYPDSVNNQVAATDTSKSNVGRRGCTPAHLRAAAALVGNVVADIEAHLRPVRDIEREQAALRAAFLNRPPAAKGLMALARRMVVGAPVQPTAATPAPPAAEKRRVRVGGIVDGFSPCAGQRG